MILDATLAAVSALSRAGEAIAHAATPDPLLRQATKRRAHAQTLVANICLLDDVKSPRNRARVSGRIAGAAAALEALDVDVVSNLLAVAAVMDDTDAEGQRDAEAIRRWCAAKP